MSTTKSKQWKAAMHWVKCNQTLIGHIAAPYRKYMASGSKDIEQEAILAAFCTLTILTKKKEHVSRFGAYFRVQFRTRCIKMATGGMTSSIRDIGQIASHPSEKNNAEPNEKMMDEALQSMSNRQRQIAGWVLAQPSPVNTTAIAEEFGIRGRTVRSIICNAINRVEQHHENTGIRKNISITA